MLPKRRRRSGALEKVIAQERGAPEFFDVFDNEPGAFGVADVGGPGGVVHGVGEVAGQPSCPNAPSVGCDQQRPDRDLSRCGSRVGA